MKPPNTLPSLSAATPSGIGTLGSGAEMKAVYHAVLDAADADALPERRVHLFTRLRVGHVNYVIADIHAARATELLPFRQKFSILIENLDAVVRPVGDEQASGRVHGETMGYIEFALSRTMVAPGFDEFSVLRVFDDTIVGFRHRKIAVAVGDKDIAVRGNKNVGRTVKLIGSVAGYAGLAERPQRATVRRQLHDNLLLAVRNPNRSVGGGK